MKTPHSSDEVKRLASEKHPEWGEAELNAYLAGYFDSMLDGSANDFEQKRQEREINLTIQRNKRGRY